VILPTQSSNGVPIHALCPILAPSLVAPSLSLHSLFPSEPAREDAYLHCRLVCRGLGRAPPAPMRRPPHQGGTWSDASPSVPYSSHTSVCGTTGRYRVCSLFIAKGSASRPPEHASNTKTRTIACLSHPLPFSRAIPSNPPTELHHVIRRGPVHIIHGQTGMSARCVPSILDAPSLPPSPLHPAVCVYIWQHSEGEGGGGAVKW
jgi:hypothetical protein